MAQVTIATGFDVDYYLDQVGADYYLNAEGEPPGIWAGSAAPGLGLVGQVDPDVMRALYHHDTAPDGTPIGTAQRGPKYAAKRVSERVDALVATLGTALDQGKLKSPGCPRWDNLDQDQEAAQLTQLREWVDGVLRVQHPGYTVPDCWPAHREALWELGALHAEWQRIFGEPRGADLESMLWFHERWLPGTLARLDKAISNTKPRLPAARLRCLRAKDRAQVTAT